MRWPQAREDRLRILWAEGHYATAIAQIFTRESFPLTRNAVIGKAHRLHLPARKMGNPGAGRKRTDPATHKRRRPPRIPRLVMPRKVLVVPPAPLPPDCEPVTLMQLEAHHCRYPIGETNGPDTLFCGADRDDTTPYCVFHHARCLRPLEPRRQRLPYYSRSAA